MKKTILILIFSGLIIKINAQPAERMISGSVSGVNEKNQREILPGANIYWLNTTIGTTADSKGKFILKWPSGNSHLVVSFMGYHNDTISVPGDAKDLQIMLQPVSAQLSEVVIEEKRGTLFYSRVNPIQTQIVTQDELRKAACCNLSESFETNAAIDVNYADAITGAKQIQMLGLAGIYSQLQIENIPNLRGLASSYGLGYVPGPWMESIQISKGASSVKNGYESVSGQINVEYKKPFESERLHVNLYGDANGRAEYNLYKTLKAGKRWKNITMIHAEDVYRENDINADSFLDLPYTRQINFINRWSYQGKKGMEMQTGFKILGERRIGGQLGFNPETDLRTTNFYGIQILTQRYELFNKTGFVFQKGKERSIGFINSLIFHNSDGTYGLNIYEGTQFTWYSNLIFEKELIHEKQKITTGISFVYDDYTENLELLFVPIPLQRREIVPGVFAEFNYHPTKKINLLIGLRDDYHNLYGNFITPRIHFKYSFNEVSTLRLSAGKGMRVANVIADNPSILVSNRTLLWEEALEPEVAWNYGFFYSRDILIRDILYTVNIDFFRTDFVNQVIIDMEQMMDMVHFYNLRGKSYSNSFQADLSFVPRKRMNVMAAFRYNDVKATYNGKLLEKPMTSRVKALLNLAYATRFNKWKFDLTASYNGRQRLFLIDSSEISGSDLYSPDFVMLNAQITKKYKKWEFYAGGENLLNITQTDPILAYDRPFSIDFDASRVWGPILGRRIYFGLRYTLK